MTIQPGVGYTFTSSSLGTNLNIEKPWSEWDTTKPGQNFYSPFQCLVTEEEEEGGGTGWFLQIVKGTVVYANNKQATQVAVDFVTANDPGIVVDGEDPASIFADNGGYCILTKEVPWAVYLVHVKLTESDQHMTYLYVVSSEYSYPSTNFVAYDKADIPPGIPEPETAYTMSVVQLAEIQWVDNKFELRQDLLGHQFFPTVTPPSQFAVDVINREKDIALPPAWKLRMAKGVIIYPADSPEGCTNVVWVEEFAPECFPDFGDYPGSPYANQNGGVDVDKTNDYDVYLFLVKEPTDDGFYPILWVGPTANYTDQCPVVLPENIAPEGEYEAKSIHIAFVEQKDLTSDTWVVNQIVQGTITQPDLGVGNKCKHPFEVKRNGMAESIVWSVCEGTVNNVLPKPAFDTFTQTDGLVWLRVEYQEPNFPSVSPEYNGITVGYGPTVPADTDTYGYIVIASITDDVVTQLVTGSLWANRIKLGNNTARYFWARI